MAASFVGIESAESGTEVTSLEIDVHADTEDGDFLLLAYYKDDDVAGSEVVEPDGWQRVPGTGDYFWREARSERASYTISTTLARRAIAAIQVWRGIDVLAPIADSDVATIGSGTSQECPALTFPAGDYVLIAGVETDGGGITFTAPTGFTEALDAETGGAGTEHVGGSLAYKIVTAATNAAAATFTSSDTVANAAAVQIALRTGAASAAGVLIDWNNDGFGQGADDDVSANVVHWTISRGASAEVTGGSQPGSCTLVLKNPSDIYNPRNASSDLFGLLRDGPPIWIGPNSDGLLTGSTPRGLFGGRITDITLIPSPGTPDPATVEITGEDFLGWAQRLPIQVDHAEGRAHDALRVAALQAAGEYRYDLANEIHTMPLSHADGNLRSVLDGLNSVNGTRHLAKPSNFHSSWFTYTTRNRQWRLDAASDASLSATDDHVTGTSGWRLSADTVINRQKATVIPIAFTPATFTVWQADSLPFGLTEDKPRTFIVDFDDVVRDPVLDIASTGDTVTSTLTPFATGAKVELSVATGDTATVTSLSIEGRLARRLPAESAVEDDTTSQAAPRGVREGGEISGEYVGVLASAQGIAAHVVWRYGDPQLRPTLTVENWLPEQFELDLYDLISFTSTHLGMTARLFEIVGLTHEGNRAATGAIHHVTTYVLQECKVQAEYDWFYLDSGPNSSVLDGDFHLAY